jgi:Uma2 family endonuclease
MTPAETKLMTAEEFHAWASLPENEHRHLELVRGKVEEMPPPGKPHGFVCGNLGGLLWHYTRQQGLFYLCHETGFLTTQGPDSVRGPDLSLYDDGQRLETFPTKYEAAPPVLTVEVLSPSNRWTQIQRKVAEYLRCGVRLVWVVDPEVRSVTVFRPGKDHYVVDNGEDLTGDGVLPDFRCRVADFFTVGGK